MHHIRVAIRHAKITIAQGVTYDAWTAEIAPSRAYVNLMPHDSLLEAGTYPFVSHAFADATKGAVGMFEAR